MGHTDSAFSRDASGTRGPATWINQALVLGIIILAPLNQRVDLSNMVPYVGGRLCALELFFPLILLLWLIKKAFVEKELPRLRAAHWCLAGYAVAATISALLSAYLPATLFEASKFYYFFLLLVILTDCLAGRAEIDLSIRAALWVALAVALIGVGGYWAHLITGQPNFAVSDNVGFATDLPGMVSGAVSVDSTLWRIASTFYHPNGLVPYLAYGVTMAFIAGKLFTHPLERLACKVLGVACAFIVSTGLYRNAFMVWGAIYTGLRHFRLAIPGKVVKWGCLVLFAGFLFLALLQTYFMVVPVKILFNPQSHRVEGAVSSNLSGY